jgi:hypothetical protein
MGITYERCELAWAKRRGKDWKAVQRDCRLTMDGDDFIIKYHGWYAGRGTGVSREEGLPLMRINRDDIVTILSDGRVEGCKQQITLPHRFTDLLNMSVFRNAALKNREHITRIYPTYGEHQPFFAGLQIDMKERKLLNPKQDISVVVNKKHVAEASQKTRTLRKLTMGMARMGAFDEFVRLRLTCKALPTYELEAVNFLDPTGNDAQQVFIAGLSSVDIPNLSYYNENGQWSQRTEAERIKILLDNAVQKGLELMRRYMYDTTEGAYVQMPVQQRNAR